jgi:hypothetical protein
MRQPRLLACRLNALGLLVDSGQAETIDTAVSGALSGSRAPLRDNILATCNLSALTLGFATTLDRLRRRFLIYLEGNP